MNDKVEISILNDVVIEFLENYIWKNGFDKLSENPFDVYKDMVKSNKGKQSISSKTARLVMITLMSKTHEKAKKDARLMNLQITFS